MIKIAHVQQLASIRGLPAEVMNTIREAVSILDNEYGDDRDVDSGYGGFVMVIEDKEDRGTSDCVKSRALIAIPIANMVKYNYEE